MRRHVACPQTPYIAYVCLCTHRRMYSVQCSDKIRFPQLRTKCGAGQVLPSYPHSSAGAYDYCSISEYPSLYMMCCWVFLHTAIMHSTLVKFLSLAFICVIDGVLCQEDWKRQSQTDGSGSEPTMSEYIYTSLHAS